MVEEVFKEEEQISIFQRLIQTPSENPGNFEEAIALEIQQILKREGIFSKLKYVDEKRPNLYAVLEGEQEGKTLLYNGHLDTVPAGNNWHKSPFSAYKDKNNYIYGRGAADMKSGIASMLYAAICLKRMGKPKAGKLIIFFNVDEEVSNKGMRQFLKEDIAIDYAIISEPTNLDVNIGHKGVLRFKIKTKGTAGHAAFVTDPNNAIEKMNKLLTCLFDYGHQIVNKKKDKFLGKATSNVTVIRGGITGNIIPDECSITIDRRTLPNETEESILQEYHDFLKGEAPDTDYEIETSSYLPASLIDEDHILVQTVYEIAKKNKKDIRIKDFEATCESPFFSVMRSIPTIIYGPGKLEQAHVANEYVHSSQVIDAGKNFIYICIGLLEDDKNTLDNYSNTNH